MTHQRSPDVQECIDRCQSCHNICLESIQHCLHKGGKHSAPRHISLLMDCAEICRTSEDFMLNNSELHPEICKTCAIVCERCAEECESLSEDPQMKHCAEICRACAESCRRMEVSIQV